MRRLALARALLKPADLVILDEPDASLDAANAALVGRAIEILARRSAVLFIAHRPENVEKADRVLRLEAGHLLAEIPA